MPDAMGGRGSGNSRAIRVSCTANFQKYQSDCSGFLKAVVSDLNDALKLDPPIKLSGQANDICDQLKNAPWIPISGNSMSAHTAMQVAGTMAATSGNLVVASRKQPGNGHVAIVLDQINFKGHPDIGPAGLGKAAASWGQLGGVGKQYREISQSFSSSKLKEVYYCYLELPKHD